MLTLQLLFVLVAIIIGARLGGIGLGVMGGVGMAILVFVFGLEPTSPPIDVMLMIAAVISAAAAMQAAGGLDYLVMVAEKLLRKHPEHITIVSPLVTYLFSFVAGTGHVAYSVLPVIAEVAHETKIRPERPLGIAVIASQQAITASPISAATVALLGLLAGFDITLFDILKVSIPATLVGVLVGAFFSRKVGKELMEDPEYLRRVEQGMIKENNLEINKIKSAGKAKISVCLFLLSTLLIVLFGSIPGMRPSFNGTPLDMPELIEILMLSTCAIILLITKVNGIAPTQGSVFIAGMQAVIAIFGVAWMGDTFINGNITVITEGVKDLVTQWPWLFALALFVMSILLYSQAATVRAIMPLGIALGMSPWMLIALFPAVNGYFFIPNYPTIVAAINFDRTGSTRIGKYILNHSFMMPGMIATVCAVLTGLLLIQFYN
ncbi:MAG: anaerobic C4-dicarboxylate transporter [Muribaculaceae bacterium]|nr:anaerobic C4-dicarboxylate transporter [Muribaculaceae bacterium]